MSAVDLLSRLPAIKATSNGQSTWSRNVDRQTAWSDHMFCTCAARNTTPRPAWPDPIRTDLHRANQLHFTLTAHAWHFPRPVLYQHLSVIQQGVSHVQLAQQADSG